jgi:CBS domain containing-hemolysin-like protein
MSDPDPSQRPSDGAARNGAQRAANDRFVARLRHLLGLRGEGSLREEFADALAAEEAEAGTQFSPEERALLRNVLALRERRVHDAMVPRADIVAVEEQVPLGELLQTFRDAGHSRIPVYRESLDEPIGMVHIKDVMNAITAGSTLSKTAAARRRSPAPGGIDLKQVNLARPLSGTRLIRKVLFVPPSMPTLDLLAQMQATRIHMAIVIDEYGGTDGLVTIEDLMEEIVGDIEDEHDLDEAPSIVPDELGVRVDARVSIEDVGRALGIDFSADEAAEEVDTIGGLVFALVGRVPVRGEIIPYGDVLEMEVLDADPRRIKKLRLHPPRQDGISRPALAAPPAALPAPQAEGATPEEVALEDRAPEPLSAAASPEDPRAEISPEGAPPESAAGEQAGEAQASESAREITRADQR